MTIDPEDLDVLLRCRTQAHRLIKVLATRKASPVAIAEAEQLHGAIGRLCKKYKLPPAPAVDDEPRTWSEGLLKLYDETEGTGDIIDALVDDAVDRVLGNPDLLEKITTDHTVEPEDPETPTE